MKQHIHSHVILTLNYIALTCEVDMILIGAMCTKSIERSGIIVVIM